MSGKPSELPLFENTLPQAELLHRAVASVLEKTRCAELIGKNVVGSPLTNHRHAHVLPVDLDADGHLDHIVLHAPMGLRAVAQDAIRRVKRTWAKGCELVVAIAGQGDIEDLRRMPEDSRAGIEALLGQPGGARSWVSSTPFVAPRYIKRRGKNTLAGQVLAELASRRLPPASIHVLPSAKLRHFIRVRRYPAPRPPADAGFALQLDFDAAVTGPLTLGYAAHYGLGMFASM